MPSNNRLSICTFALVFQLLTAGALHPQTLNVRLSNHFDVNPGDTLELSILVQSPLQLGGVDFRIHFVDSIFRFISVQKDTGIKNWEFFSPSFDSAEATVRVPAIADLPFPPQLAPEDFYPRGSIAKIRFEAKSGWTDDSSQVPFGFYWKSCADNACSNLFGDSLMIIQKLFACNGTLLWDETDNNRFPESSRPPHVGVVDSCQEASSKLLFQLNFQNGFAANYHICGDADGSFAVDISDAVYLIAYIFSGGPLPNPVGAGDVDCSGAVDISDAVLLVGYIFSGGPAPCSCR